MTDYGGVKQRFKTIMSEREIRNLGPQMIGRRNGFCTLPFLRKGKRPLQLNLKPDLADVCPAFFALEKSVVKKRSRSVIVTSFCQIQNELVSQGRRHVGAVRRTLKPLHPLAGRPAQAAESLIESRTALGIGRVTP